jgi:hypothetical protein
MIIWIASYPKSGNTWIRSMLGSLMYTEDGIFNFQTLDKIKQFPSINFFKQFTKDYQNINEIKKNWILAQDKINLDDKVKFFKTHNANCKIGDHYFTNKSNTLASIYIIRDPRNIVTSISNHYNFSIEYSKKFITTSRSIGGSSDVQNNLSDNSILTILGSWKDHVASWTRNNPNLLIIKYEDLINNIELETDKLIKFINKYTPLNVTDNIKKNCIKSTSFDNLKSLEKSTGFIESASKNLDNKKNFFYLGKDNRWEEHLSSEILNSLENEFADELIKFGYLKP